MNGTRAAVALRAPLKPGDGVVFDTGKPQDDEPGGRVFHVWRDGRRVEAADAPDRVEFEVRGCPSPQPGWKVWKTDDPAINRRLRATFQKTGVRVPVDALVEEAGDLLRVTLSDGANRVTGETGPLQVAQKRPLTPEYLRKQLGRLGDTPFELRGLEVRLGNVMVPVSRINDLRRRLAEDLERVRRVDPGYRIRPGALERLRAAPPRTEGDARLAVFCTSLDQVRTALGEGIGHLECDFEDIRKYRDAVAAARERGAEILLAPPRIFKPGETGILRNLLRAEPDGILVRSTAHLAFYRREAPRLALAGDFSLNAANELTVDWLLPKGLARFVPSYDLNWDQLQALLDRVDPGRAEVVVHHHMPMFHMEHCVFAAFLSKGRDCTDCGRACDRHAVSLRDRMGMEHPVRADVACRNTIYNAVPQSAAEYVRRLRERGVRVFRVELLHHGPEETRRLIRGYRDVLEGKNDGRALWRELRASNTMGVTRGPLGRDE